MFSNSAHPLSSNRYWIPKQGDKDMLNNGKTVTLNGPKTKTLKTKKGKTIAKVSKTTYEVMHEKKKPERERD
jgi:hypothetical protein